MKKCPFCSKENQDERLTCARCGRKVATAPRKGKKALIVGAILIGVLILIGLNLDAFLDVSGRAARKLIHSPVGK
jgi:predicted nucleic acid-binding Zn ribbon protein